MDRREFEYELNYLNGLDGGSEALEMRARAEASELGFMLSSFIVYVFPSFEDGSWKTKVNRPPVMDPNSCGKMRRSNLPAETGLF